MVGARHRERNADINIKVFLIEGSEGTVHPRR